MGPLDVRYRGLKADDVSIGLPGGEGGRGEDPKPIGCLRYFTFENFLSHFVQLQLIPYEVGIWYKAFCFCVG